MSNQDLISCFQSEGACIVPKVIAPELVLKLKTELIAAIDQDLRDTPDVFDAGMVHNCMFRGPEMLRLLDHALFNAWTKRLLHPHCIIYAYQSSSLPPGQGNYGSRIHVDCPRFIPDYMTNMGVIFPLDDFTEDNGATYFLPGSHRMAQLPNEDRFFAGAQRLLANAGDMVLFNARLAHAAGVNKTQSTRHALTINLCRHYMKQRFDLPRMISEQDLASLGEEGKRLIGMNARVPTSLDEFYVDPKDRLYQPGQD